MVVRAFQGIFESSVRPAFLFFVSTCSSLMSPHASAPQISPGFLLVIASWYQTREVSALSAAARFAHAYTFFGLLSFSIRPEVSFSRAPTLDMLSSLTSSCTVSELSVFISLLFVVILLTACRRVCSLRLR
jgi:hypothetical protein